MDERIGRQERATIKSLQERIEQMKVEKEKILERIEVLEADFATAYASIMLKQELLLKSLKALRQEFLASQNRLLLEGC